MKQTALTGEEGHILLTLLSPWYVGAISAYFVQAICWIMALRRIPLNMAYPFLSLVFVLNLVGARFLFHETVTSVHMAGILLIIAGVTVSSRGRVKE